MPGFMRAGAPGYKAVQAKFIEVIPAEREHMLHYYAASAVQRVELPFFQNLCWALAEIDNATPGYAAAMLEKIAAIRGISEQKYEAIIQLLAEVYVAQGAVYAADGGGGQPVLVAHEPGVKGAKNPELEACSSGVWYAVEVKTPCLIAHDRERAQNPTQIVARLGVDRESFGDGLGAKTRPRDNPVKDFLVSAQAKYEAYEQVRAGAIRVLAIVWNDYIQEPVSSLLHPASGLLTPQSFYRTDDDKAVRFDHVDAVLLIRHRDQLARATRDEPLMDGHEAFVYHGPAFPPKVIVPVPGGRKVPDEVMRALQAQDIAAFSHFAECRPQDLIMWINPDDGPGAGQRG